MVGISVIVPVYNGAHEITHLLDALSAQTQDPATVEYIIVNNNSSDQTREVVETYAKTAKINLLCIDENEIQGSYAARNTGIRAATGEILVFTDADCMPDPDWVKNILPGFDDPSAGAVAGAIHGFPGDTLLEKFATKREILSQIYPLKHEFLPFAQTANLSFRRDVFRKAGLFRASLKTAGDADMCWRMQQATDYKLSYRENAAVLHRHRTNFADLYEQFERYGRSVVYLKQIYGWNALREPRLPYYIRKLAVWAVLKYPGLLIRYLKKEITKVDLYEEPLKLYIKWCSHRGAVHAHRLGPIKNLDIEYPG